MRLDGFGAPFTLVGAHLGRPWPWQRFGGDRAQLAAYVRSQGPATTIVAGDFNLPGWTYQMRALDKALGLPRASRLVPSWPAILNNHPMPWPLVGIDHLFAGRAWAVIRLERGPFLGSDHYPLVAELQRCDGVGRH